MAIGYDCPLLLFCPLPLPLESLIESEPILIKDYSSAEAYI